jgi:V8-like Glu-specific endopeptidase
LACCLAAGPAAAQADACATPVEAATKFGTIEDPQLVLDATTKLRPLPKPDFEMRYAMLRLKASGTAQGDWLLTLRDGSFKVLALLSADDFANAPNRGIWTNRLEAGEIFLDLFIGDPQNSNVRITVDEALMMPAKVGTDVARYSWRGAAATYESLYMPKRFTPGIDARQKLQRLGDRVGFIVGMARPSDNSQISWCCSGVMLTDDIFLTNWHCGGWSQHFPENSVWSTDVCNTTFVDLSWDEDRVGREYNCATVIRTERQKQLDYTLVRLAPIANAAGIAPGPSLRISQSAVALGDELRMIHHAECKKKLVSYDCHVKNAAWPGRKLIEGEDPLTDFAHDCDTESGSSGAPVFDMSGALVGLHRAGHEPKAGGGCDGQNKAVHIMRILEDIKSSQPTIYEEITSRLAAP